MADIPEPFREPRPEADDGDWRAGPYGRCRRLLPLRPVGSHDGQGYRRRSCPNQSVASCRRGRLRTQRWGYCALHLADYGRTVRGTHVWWDPAGAETVKLTYRERT